MTSVITEFNQITLEWLTSRLERTECFTSSTVTGFHAELVDTQSSSSTARIKLSYAAEVHAAAPHVLFLKWTHPEMIDVFPEIGQKEIQFYQSVMSERAPKGLVRCYDAVYDASRKRFHLLLDDLTETHFSLPFSLMPPSKLHAEAMIDALAQHHAFWWNEPRLGRTLGSKPSQDSEAIKLGEIEALLPRFFDFLGDRLSEKRQRYLERIAENWMQISERLTASQNLTLTHGDIHAGQFLFPQDESNSAYLIDWDHWKIELGTADLAYMMAISWFPEHRLRFERPLLQRYHEQLLACGVRNYDQETLCDDYRRAVIRALYFPLRGWSKQPVPEFWWLRFERWFMAFDDLKCAELLAC